MPSALIWTVMPALLFAACRGGPYPDVECGEDEHCNFLPGGVCKLYEPTGRKWCHYADETCETGHRWQDFDIGDGLEGQCVEEIDVTGHATWLATFGGPEHDAALDVAVSPDGSIVVTGRFSGAVRFGEVLLQSADSAGTFGNEDAFVAKLDRTGSLIWAVGFGGGYRDGGAAVAVNRFGDVLVAGVFSQTVDFGTGPITAHDGQWDAFLLSLVGNTGALMWVSTYGGDGVTVPTEIALDANDDVLMTGWFGGTADFGGGPQTSMGSSDIFIAKYDGLTGAHIWSSTFGSTSGESAFAIATSGNDFFIAGSYSETLSFGGAPIEPHGNGDTFVAAFSQGGNGPELIWSRGIGNSMYHDRAMDIVALGDTCYLSMEIIEQNTNHVGDIDLGFGRRTGSTFLAAYDAKTAAHRWSLGFGDGDLDVARHMQVSQDGTLLVSGTFKDQIDLGGPILTTTGESGNGMFVARYGSLNGGYISATTFSGNATPFGAAIAGSDMVVVGQFWDTLAVEDFSATSAGSEDIFIARVQP